MFQANVLDHTSLFLYIAVVKIRSDLTVCEVIDASDPYKQSLCTSATGLYGDAGLYNIHGSLMECLLL